MSSLTETLKSLFLPHGLFPGWELFGDFIHYEIIVWIGPGVGYSDIFDQMSNCPDSGDQWGPALPPQGSARKAMRAWVSPWGLHLVSHSKSSQDPWSSSWECVPTPSCGRIVPRDAPVRAVTLPPGLIGLLLQGPAGDLTMRSSCSVTPTVKSQETNFYLLVTQISPGRQRGCNRNWGLPPHSVYYVHPMGGPTDSILPRTQLRWGSSLLSFHRGRDYGSEKPNHLYKVKQLKSGGIRIWSKESPRDRNF